MIKKASLLLIITLFLTGCMPSPIEKTKENKYQTSMISRALTSEGNNYRISNKIREIKKGEPIIIGFIGSSTFVEKENETSVAQYSLEKIKKLFSSKANLKYTNLSIKNTDSIFGNIIIKKKFLKDQPDIIFLDYSAFDKNEQEDREAFESIIRTCLEQENEPQIIIILNSNAENIIKQDFMEQLAKYYNLPVINVNNALLPEISSGRLKAEDLFIDLEKKELSEAGKNTVADIITNYFVKIQKQRKDKDYIIPTQMYTQSNIMKPKYIDAKDIQADNDGSYVREKNENNIFSSKIKYLTDTENIPFIFTVEANNIYIILPVSKNRTNIAEIYINAKKTQEINTYAENEEDIPKVFKIFSSNKSELIAVAIKIKETENIEEGKTEETENIEQKKDFEFWGIAYTKDEKNIETE